MTAGRFTQGMSMGMKMMVGGALLCGVLATGCEVPERPADIGEVKLALSLPNGVTVNSVSWRVLSSSSAALASGSTNTSNVAATPSFSVGLPPGTGDTVEMKATTSTGINCTGTSAPFDVVGGAHLAVAVNVLCGNVQDDPNLGSITVTGVLVAGDSCPVVSAWMISPQQTSANGGTIDVAVTASDADSGEVVSFAWDATAGSFVNPALASTQYTCGPAGTQTLLVHVSDDHAPTPCTVNVSFPSVRCGP